MAKPVFSPEQFELRNELPTFVSDDQQSAIVQETDRVNQQLDWVAQALGWSGQNYWTNLPQTVHQKRAILGGTFGVYNSYTLLRLLEIRSWENVLVTEFKPNIEVGQRVIIGDRQAYIYEVTEEADGTRLAVNIGTLSAEILSLLERGAAIKVDCPQNRPFPFYRPDALASGDADFRCSTGNLTRTTQFYDFYDLVLSPFSQNNILVPYKNLQFYGGSYYYFDRAVYLAIDNRTFVPWIECEWIESKGLWQLYVPPEAIGNSLYLVWSYASPSKKAIATAEIQVTQWTDPSDWGQAGQGFNPILDIYKISKSYDTAGLNYSLGTRLHLGDDTPLGDNPLWFDAGSQSVYALNGGQWVNVGTAKTSVSLDGAAAPPPVVYDYTPGNIWQDPTGRTYIWDAGYRTQDFYYFFPNGLIDGFFYIDPSSQNVQGLYLFDPDNFYIHYPSYLNDGFWTYNCTLEEDGLYYNDPFVTDPQWYEVEFFNESLFQSIFTPAYNSNLQVLVDGRVIPSSFKTANYTVDWRTEGYFLFIAYTALTEEGEYFVPRITVLSTNGTGENTIDISADFKARPTEVTSIPYNELGVLNNFRGAWGNKGGARPMDLCFDSLDIHGFNEQEALFLEPVIRPINFDWLLQQVTGKQVYVGDAPPPAASVGDYYWNTETGALAVMYEDADRNKIWIEVNVPISPCQVGTPFCDFFPLKPVLSSGSCKLDNGDLWQDPETPGVALYFEGLSFNPTWVEVNWNNEQLFNNGWPFSGIPGPDQDFSVLTVYITDDFIKVEPGVLYQTPDYVFSYDTDPVECAFIFKYEALSPAGVQKQPTVWIGPSAGNYPPAQITQQIFSSAKFYLAPAVQNAGCLLRPWRTESLEVCDESSLVTETFLNPLQADTNLGPGDEDWTRSFIRLPSEYGRSNIKWSQAQATVQDFTYAGTAGDIKEMECPSEPQTPQIFEEVIFKRQDPAVGSVLYSEPYIYSDVEGITNLTNYYSSKEQVGEFADADFDYSSPIIGEEWNQASFTEYDPLHFRQVFSTGDWTGIYIEPTGGPILSGFLERDLRVKSIIPVPAPVWDASIYKFPPLCPESDVSYDENPNNCKVGYAYFAADLAAAEDGFFDQSQNVAWREPLVEDQTLYTLN